MKELPKVYDPRDVESRIYKLWMDGDCFKAEPNPDKKPFSIVMPPPNVTGQLHMGHALDCTLQDILTRFKRMQGYEALWLPGSDHAGIATQIKVEEELRKNEGLTRYDLGREKFLERVWAWKEKYGSRIVEQQKKMGASCDWSRDRFTMDEGCSRAVRETFCELYEKGLIYKGSRIINWCPHCLTALSDAEVEYTDKPGNLWYIRYPLSDGSGDIVIATTRPETMFGDTGVAVNPEDEKFKHLIGKTCILPIMNREIPIVGDDYCEIGFGTGAVKMTPAHDPNDFEVGLRHNLEVIRCISDDGTMNENAGKYEGMDRYACRKAVVADLETQGYLVKTEPYSHNVGTCYRCHNDVEPLISAQWFVKMAPLAKEAIRVVEDGTIKFVPERFTKTYINWMENVHDWCISRQRTWGVPLPVFFDENGKAVLDAALVRKIADMVEKHGSNIWFELSDEDLCERLGLPKTWKKGKDTLDVWIDSGSSHMAVMDNRPGLDAPADLYLEATDQHRGWFQSSLMLSVAWRGKAPYKAVMTHGFVVDKDTGKKTSKSDAKSGKPIDAAYYYDKYGADIVRLWAASVDWQNEVPFGEDLFKQVTEPYRRLRNTLRILLGNISGFDFAAQAVAPEHMPLLDRWILERLNAVIRETLKAYEAYDFRKAFSAINQFCTSDLSALYVDTTKDRLYCDSSSSVRRRATQTAMTIIFKALCRLLAPILAFTADEAWEYAGYEGSVHEQDFPAPMPEYDTQEATSVISRLQEIRSVIQVAIEEQVKAKVFSKNNEASITLTVPVNESEDVVALLEDRAFATEFFIIADLDVKTGPELAASAAKTEHAMCPRCRRYEPAAEGGDVCERCAEVLS